VKYEFTSVKKHEENEKNALSKKLNFLFRFFDFKDALLGV